MTKTLGASTGSSVSVPPTRHPTYWRLALHPQLTHPPLHPLNPHPYTHLLLSAAGYFVVGSQLVNLALLSDFVVEHLTHANAKEGYLPTSV